MTTHSTRIATCPNCEGDKRLDDGKLCQSCDGTGTLDYDAAILWRVGHDDDKAMAFTEWLATFLRDYMSDGTRAVADTLWDGLGAPDFVAMMHGAAVKVEDIRRARRKVAALAAQAKAVVAPMILMCVGLAALLGFAGWAS